ncbi:hypothetical protein ACIQCM_00630 [Pseudarthrobacter sp. NPDC092439]|uniref:hypothetical protein n=1 Tax=unclassified Pseudarthrobacter TaxID=2647000 RepID=UPI00381D8E9A
MAAWIHDNQDVREDILSQGLKRGTHRLTGGVLHAMAGDPGQLVDFGNEVAVEAIRRDAPVLVADELLAVSRRMATGELALTPYIHSALDGLRGLHDESEMVPALERAVPVSKYEFNLYAGSEDSHAKRKAHQ